MGQIAVAPTGSRAAKGRQAPAVTISITRRTKALVNLMFIVLSFEHSEWSAKDSLPLHALAQPQLFLLTTKWSRHY